METNATKSVSLRKAFENKVITNISKVRVNASGYPYVTVLNGSKSNNVYFGKKSGALVTEGQHLSVDQLTTATLLLATNEAGEQRLKLGLGGSDSYTNLESIFGSIDSSADEKEVLRSLAVAMVAREEASATTPAITA
mgnify:FL=1